MLAAAGYAGVQLIAMLTAVGSCAFVLRSQPPNDEDEEQYLDEKLACYAHAARMQITNCSPSKPLTKEEMEAL